MGRDDRGQEAMVELRKREPGVGWEHRGRAALALGLPSCLSPSMAPICTLIFRERNIGVLVVGRLPCPRGQCTGSVTWPPHVS